MMWVALYLTGGAITLFASRNSIHSVSLERLMARVLQALLLWLPIVLISLATVLLNWVTDVISTIVRGNYWW